MFGRDFYETRLGLKTRSWKVPGMNGMMAECPRLELDRRVLPINGIVGRVLIVDFQKI